MDEDILIVTHSGTIRVIIYYFDNKSVYYKQKHAKNYRYLKINNYSIYIFDNKGNYLNMICNKSK